MPSLSPILHDLKSYRLDCDLDIIDEQWEIVEACDQDIVWNVVMAYLNYYPREEGAELDNRLKSLGVKKLDRHLKGYVTRYNPFQRQNTFCCEKITELVVKPFKRLIDEFRSNYPDDSTVSDLDSFLYACATILSSSILLVKRTISNGVKSGVPQGCLKFPQYANEKILVIFVEFSNDEKEELDCGSTGESFSFGISKEYGRIKQRIALRNILKSIKFSEEDTIKEVMHNIMRLPGMEEHFLISILKSDFANYVFFLYKSPYLVSKLQDAGLVLDPCAEDAEGRNGLYWALLSGNTSVLYFLYNHAANGCFLVESSVRSPNIAIIENLKTLQSQLCLIYAKIKCEKELGKEKKKIEEVIRLNKFQVEICSNAFEISEKFKNEHSQNERNVEGSNNSDFDSINLSISTDNSAIQNEALLRKELISSILKTYRKYFYWSENPSNNSDSTVTIFPIFEEFNDHYDYYNNLDFCSTVMFFDKLFLLKDRLKLSNELYLEIESKFFFFIYSKKYLIEINKTRFLAMSDLPDISKMILSQMRLDLEKGIDHFQNELEGTTISDNNIVKVIPEDSVQTLTNLPIIHDEFLITKLDHYLQIATEVKPKNNDIFIYVIERALQVIGECLTQTNVGFKSVKKIIRLLLPGKLRQAFLRIRNTFSHVTAETIQRRKMAEKDLDMFKGIQKELEIVKNYFLPIIFIAHKYAIDRFMLARISSNVSKIITGTVPKENFKNLKTNLEKEILTLDAEHGRKIQCMSLEFSMGSLFSSIQEEITRHRNRKQGIEKVQLLVDDYFWCVEFILKFITIDELLEKYHKTLKEKIKSRKFDLFFNIYRNETNYINTNTTDENDSFDYNGVFSNGEMSPLVQSSPNFSDNKINLSMTDFIEKAKDLLKEYEAISKEIVGFITKTNKERLNSIELVNDSAMELESSNDAEEMLSFKNIKTLGTLLFGKKPVLTPKKKKELHKFRNFCFDEVDFAKRRVISHLDGSTDLSREELMEEVSHLCLSKTKFETFRKTLDCGDKENCSKIIEGVPNYSEELRSAIETCEINKRRCECLCRVAKERLAKEMAIATDKIEARNVAITAEDFENTLRKLIKGQNKVEVPLGNPTELLLHRIVVLKKILIDKNEMLKRLWEKANYPKIKDYLIERVTEVYLFDKEIQAAVEMLLSDCMSVLHEKSLDHLLKKATNLFSGINLRNVLAHGNPLLEIIGNLMDPFDLPSELVRKIIRFISDEQTLKYLVQLAETLQSDYSYLMQVLEGQNLESQTAEVRLIREEILKNTHWKEYAKTMSKKSDFGHLIK